MSMKRKMSIFKDFDHKFTIFKGRLFQNSNFFRTCDFQLPKMMGLWSNISLSNFPKMKTILKIPK